MVIVHTAKAHVVIVAQEQKTATLTLEHKLYQVVQHLRIYHTRLVGHKECVLRFVVAQPKLHRLRMAVVNPFMYRKSLKT